MSLTRSDRPYIVCDSCGHIWTVWYDPAECENCSSGKLWQFADKDKAVQQSRDVRGRL